MKTEEALPHLENLLTVPMVLVGLVYMLPVASLTRTCRVQPLVGYHTYDSTRLTRLRAMLLILINEQYGCSNKCIFYCECRRGFLTIRGVSGIINLGNSAPPLSPLSFPFFFPTPLSLFLSIPSDPFLSPFCSS